MFYDINTYQAMEARKSGKDFSGALVDIGVDAVRIISDILIEGNGSPEEHSMPQHSSTQSLGKGTFIFINAHFCKKNKNKSTGYFVLRHKKRKKIFSIMKGNLLSRQ